MLPNHTDEGLRKMQEDKEPVFAGKFLRLRHIPEVRRQLDNIPVQ